MKAVAALDVARRALLVGVRREQRGVEIDRDPTRGTGELPDVRASPSVRAVQRVDHPRRGGDPVDHPKRRGVRRHPPEQRRLIAHRAQIGEAVAAVGEHHRQVTDHASRVMTTAAGAQPGKLTRQRPGQASAISDPGEQTAAGVGHQTGSVRRDISYIRRPSRVTFKVILQSRTTGLRHPEESLPWRTVQTARSPGAAAGYRKIRVSGTRC